VGSVFSREFYEIAASRLKPGGIICQWFHLYEMNDDILKLVLRTFGSVFPNMEIWETGNDIIFLGSREPWPTGPEIFRQGFSIDRVRTDMTMINIHSPEALLARQIASQRTAFAIAGEGRTQSDLHPTLEYAAPKAFFIGGGTHVLDRFDERTRQQTIAPAEKNILLHTLSPEEARYVFTDLPTGNTELFGCLFGYSTGSGVPCVFQTAQPASSGADDSIVSQAKRAFQAGNMEQAEALAAAAIKQAPADDQAGYLLRVIQREKAKTGKRNDGK
jgi:hypothetical protein